MKTFIVSKTGNVPEYISTNIGSYHGRDANNENFSDLDSDITFIVTDCRDAHGNTSSDKTGWLCSKTNGGNDWSVKIDIK